MMPMSVKISENLFFEMVDLLMEPKSMIPAKSECILHLAKRNNVLDRLLRVQRNVLFGRPETVTTDI